MRPQRKSILGICLLVAGTMAAEKSTAQAVSEHAQGEKQEAHFIFRQGTSSASTVGNHSIAMISSGYSVAGKLVTQAPYSAESITEMVQTLADGNRIVRTNTATIYRDSQGRTRREQQLDAIGPWATAGETATMIFIHDPVASVHYVLNPGNQTANKMSSLHMDARNFTQTLTAGDNEMAQPGTQIRRYRVMAGNTEVHKERHWISGGSPENVPPDAVQVMMDVNRTGVNRTGLKKAPGAGEQASPDVKTESLGTRVIEGLEARGTKTVTTIPAGAIGNEQPIEITSEQWFSEELRMTVLSTREDPRFGQTTLRLTNIQRVEPLPSLFEVPPGYTMEEGFANSPVIKHHIEHDAPPSR